MIKAYFDEHRSAIRQCLIMLGQSKLATLLSIIAIAISIFLPSGLHYVSSYFSDIKLEWQSAYKVTVFAKTNVQEEGADALHKKLSIIPGIASIETLNPDTLLETLADQLQLDPDIRDVVTEGGNPLPYAFLIQLSLDSTGENQIDFDRLEETILSLKEVDTVKIDQGWLQAIRDYARVAHKIIILIGIMLVMGMVLIISNGIRTEIHKHERLIKAQIICGVSFISVKRPYLYLGFLQGLFGSIIATSFLGLSQYYVGALPEIISTNSVPSLFNYSLFMVTLGCMIGWSSGYFSIQSHLQDIELGA